MDVGNLISGSSDLEKSSLNIWKFMVYFEHYFASLWDECNCVVVWTFFGITFLWDWNENGPFPVLWPLLSFQTQVRWVGDAIQPSHHPSSPSIPHFNLSQRVFSKESVPLIRWPKYWSFSFSISPSNEYSGLISFMMDWFDLLAVQGTLKSLLQHHSSKASILRCSAFFIVQLSCLYMTTGKTTALTR